MKFYFKFLLYAVLIIIYFYLFGIKSLDKFNEGGVLINQKTLTVAELQPKPGKLADWISFQPNVMFPGVLIIAIDPDTGIGMKTPLPYEGFSYSSIVTNASLGKKLNLWKTTKTAKNSKK